MGVPSGVTEVEKLAVEEVIRQLGAKEVYILDEPTAAAIGAGLNIDDSEACIANKLYSFDYWKRTIIFLRFL